jgi:aspartokinase
VTTTDYEAVPAVEADDAARHVGTVVMKFGGTSVGDPEKLKNVARRLVAARQGGARVVAVVSAMGSTTDELLDLARQVSPRPEPRELDMLISVGERISCALAAMAINDFGHEAISLTGSQAGIRHRHGARVRRRSSTSRAAHPRGARPGQDRARRRLPRASPATHRT